MALDPISARNWLGRILLGKDREVTLHDDEKEEIMQEIQKVPVPSTKKCFTIGDIVKWAYEVEGDPAFGTLYMVVGLNSEVDDIVVTRILNAPYQVREFHVSQLKMA